MVTIQCKEVTFPKIQAVIFDKDGTLEDSHEYFRNLGLKRSRLIDAQIPGIGEPLLMAFGIDEGNTMNRTGLLAVGSRVENEIAAAAYIAETGRGWIESLNLARNAFDEADGILKRDTPSPLFPGSLEVLKYLSDAGLKLGILSADTTKGVQDLVEFHQLGDYIQLQMGVDSSLSKPDPTLFWSACQELKVEPGATLMVGDSASDWEMAKKAGAAGSVGICWGRPGAIHLQGVDVAIAALDEIKIMD